MTPDFRNGPLVVVALDPGGTTGWALLRGDWIEGEFVNRDELYGQLGPSPHHRALLRLLELWSTHNFVIVCESFQERPEKDWTVTIALEYIGVVNTFVEENPHVHLVMQSPSQGKGFWDDRKLKKIDMYYRGMRHARDASRHLLHWLSFGPLKDETYIRRLK
jgi:hypothetical protein